MIKGSKSIRPFIGAKDFKESRSFYQIIGFKETPISDNMSLFTMDQLGFYLQDYYIEEWVNNTMLFLEVTDVEKHFNYLQSLELKIKFPTTKLKPIVNLNWGREFFLHDPSNVLWHIGNFKN